MSIAVNPGIQRIIEAPEWGAPAPGSTLAWDGTHIVAAGAPSIAGATILAPTTSARNVIQPPGNPGADITSLTIQLPAGVPSPTVAPFGILDRNGTAVMAFNPDGSLGIGVVAPSGRSLHIDRGCRFSIEAIANSNIFQHFTRFSTGNYYGLRFESLVAGNPAVDFAIGYDGAIGGDSNSLNIYNANQLIATFTKTSRNLGIRRTTAAEFGNGSGCIGLADALTVPNANPSSGGGVLYSEAGALKWRGPTTTTVIAPA